MKALALALVLSLLAVGVPAQGAAGLPTGCRADGARYVCEWTDDDTQPGAVTGRSGVSGPPLFDHPIPAFPRTLATITVTLEQYRPPTPGSPMPPLGFDAGWHVKVLDGAKPLSVSRHPGDNRGLQRPNETVTDTSVHLLLHEGGGAPVLQLVPTYADPEQPPSGTGDAQSVGTFHVRYVAEDLPEGVAPRRPAATEQDPQLLDAPDDVVNPAHDLRAAWLDDAALGDGLFEVHLTVANLTNPDFSQAPTPDPGTGGTPALRWLVHFDVAGHSYGLLYRLPSRGDADCELLSEDDLANVRVIMSPACDAWPARGTINWSVPERSVGSPGSGVLFTNLHATTDECPEGGQASCPSLDDMQGERYPFALGGPDVWSRLNPRLDPPVLPWYKDPVSEDNLPNTLQVVGTILAGLTFLGGAIAVTHRRRQTRRLLDRIDAAEQKAGVDSRAVLVALGRLEEEFTLLFRRHRISEAQYQILSQRIASVATRFALRRELGLVTGEASAVRVPVRDATPEDAPR